MRRGSHAADNHVSGLTLQRIIKGHAFANTLHNRAPAYPCGNAGVREAHLFASECHEHIVPFISGLLPCSRPPTIIRSVVTRIVDAVKRVAKRWPVTHVFYEIRERLPSLANSNTSRAILGVPRRCRIVASLNHRLPRMIGRGIVHAVNRFPARRLLAHEASARLGVARSSFDCMDNSPPSAITIKHPKVIRPAPFMHANRYQSVVSLARPHWGSFFHHLKLRTDLRGV